MIDGNTPYYTLVSSLPGLPAEYEQLHVPISRPRLEDRLQSVEQETRQFIDLLLLLLSFDSNPREESGKKAQARYAELSGSIDDRQIRKLFATVIDVRDLLAALRARILEQEPPHFLGAYGPRIRRNWHHLDFRLGHRFPWIQEVARHLANNRILAAEKKMSQICWSELRRLGQRHHFTLRALLTYLLRWLIIRHWADRNLERGQKRFSTLLDETMNGYGRLFD